MAEEDEALAIKPFEPFCRSDPDISFCVLLGGRHPIRSQALPLTQVREKVLLLGLQPYCPKDQPKCVAACSKQNEAVLLSNVMKSGGIRFRFIR